MTLMLIKYQFQKKGSYGAEKSIKYFIGYSDRDVIRPLCIKLSQMIGYAKHFENNATIPFKISDNKLLKSTLKHEKMSTI